VQPEDIAVLARAAASLLGVRDALRARAIVSATSSTEAIGCQRRRQGVSGGNCLPKRPDHRSTRRHIAALCGLTAFGPKDLAEVLGEASDPDVAQLAELDKYQDVGSLVDGAARLTIDDPDWLATCGRLRSHGRASWIKPMRLTVPSATFASTWLDAKEETRTILGCNSSPFIRHKADSSRRSS